MKQTDDQYDSRWIEIRVVMGVFFLALNLFAEGFFQINPVNFVLNVDVHKGKDFAI